MGMSFFVPVETVEAWELECVHCAQSYGPFSSFGEACAKERELMFCRGALCDGGQLFPRQTAGVLPSLHVTYSTAGHLMAELDLSHGLDAEGLYGEWDPADMLIAIGRYAGHDSKTLSCRTTLREVAMAALGAGTQVLAS